MDRPHRETKGVGFHIIFVKVIVQKIDFFFFLWYKCFIIWDFTLKFLYHFSGFCINLFEFIYDMQLKYYDNLVTGYYHTISNI